MSTVCCFNDYSFTADFEGVCCHHKLCSSLKIVVHTWSLVFSLKKKKSIFVSMMNCVHFHGDCFGSFDEDCLG